MDQILIENLEIITSIGILPEEKTAPQRIIVDCAMTVTGTAYEDEDLGSTVCYASVTEIIQYIAHAKHYNLLEVLAIDIIAACFDHDMRIQEIDLKIMKPDIMAGSQNVGVRLHRGRQDFG